MTRVFNREKTFLDPVLRPIERVVYRLTESTRSMRCVGQNTSIAMLLFSGSPWRSSPDRAHAKWLRSTLRNFRTWSPVWVCTAASFTTIRLASL